MHRKALARASGLGKAGHVEVQGIVDDLDSVEVIAEPADVKHYGNRRLGVVCQPTKMRQQALLELIRHVNAVVVVGGRNSNNTRRLVQLCREHQVPARHIESANDLDPSWFDDVQTVGLTAGTSTLDDTIEEVYRALTAL